MNDDNDWRGMFVFVVNGHQMWRLSEEEMGGGCSGITIGCWTCFPKGSSSKIARYDFWQYTPDMKTYTVNEALLQSRKDMWKHAHPERAAKR